MSASDAKLAVYARGGFIASQSTHVVNAGLVHIKLSGQLHRVTEQSLADIQ